MKRKIFLLPICGTVSLGFGLPSLVSCSANLNNIWVDHRLFDVNVSTYIRMGRQIVDASVNDSSDARYLIYLVDKNGIVTHNAITSKGNKATFSGINSDSKLFVSKEVDSTLAETGVKPTIINNLYPDYYNDNLITANKYQKIRDFSIKM